MNRTLSPFVHLFRHGDETIAYDVGSNSLHCVDEVVADVLRHCGSIQDPNDRVVFIAERHGQDEALRALTEVQAAQNDHGLFLNRHPTDLSPCSSCHAENAYDDRLMQLSLSVTELCNLRCAYCPHTHGGLEWQRPHGSQIMTKETAEKAVREFLSRSQATDEPTISFYGGEPFLALEIIIHVSDLVRNELGRHDVRLIVDTNGTQLLREEIVIGIQEYHWDLQISLDGPADVHDRERVTGDGAGTHTEIIEGLRQLLRVDPKIHQRLRFQATVAQATDLIKVVDWYAEFPLYREFGISADPNVGISMADLRGTGRSEEGDAAAFAVLWDRYVKARSKGAKARVDPVSSAMFDPDLVRFYHRQRDAMPDIVAPSGCCRAGQRRLHVTPDGSYRVCERVGNAMVIGNTETGLDVAAAQEVTDRFITATGDRCLDCWAVRQCTLCVTAIAPTWGDNGSTAVLPESKCNETRQGVESTFRMWLDLLKTGSVALDFLVNSHVR